MVENGTTDDAGVGAFVILFLRRCFCWVTNVGTDGSGTPVHPKGDWIEVDVNDGALVILFLRLSLL